MTVPKVKEESIAIDTLETAAWWFAVVVRRIYNARKIPEVNLKPSVFVRKGAQESAVFARLSKIQKWKKFYPVNPSSSDTRLPVNEPITIPFLVAVPASNHQHQQQTTRGTHTFSRRDPPTHPPSLKLSLHQSH
jgi:hypothetical protein